MDLSRSPGLAECLRGQSSLAEAVQRTCFNNLAVLTAGHVKGGQVAELLGRPELEKLLANAQRMFDYVLIDTPPVNGVSDTGIMGRACSQAMLVVRMHRTQRNAVKRALAMLRAASIEPMGIVLTGRKHYGRDSAYYYT